MAIGSKYDLWRTEPPSDREAERRVDELRPLRASITEALRDLRDKFTGSHLADYTFGDLKYAGEEPVCTVTLDVDLHNFGSRREVLGELQTKLADFAERLKWLIEEPDNGPVAEPVID